MSEGGFQLELFSATPSGPQGSETKLVQKPATHPTKKVRISWDNLNKNAETFPNYSKTTGYMIEHVSPSFERWTALEAIEFI